jgi:hypothetical protein
MNSIFASLGLRRLRSSSATTTRHVDTHHAFSRPRPVRPDRKAGSRCPRVPNDLRRWRGTASDVPIDSRRSATRLATCDDVLGAHRPGDIESRALPRRKGSSPGSTMSRAPRGHRPRLRAVGKPRADSRTVEAFHMHGVTRCTAVLPASERVPRSDAPLVKSRGAFGTFGWRESRGSLFEDLLPPASVGFACSC